MDDKDKLAARVKLAQLKKKVNSPKNAQRALKEANKGPKLEMKSQKKKGDK